MVKSGLDHKNFEGPADVPRVSQYRLASHLSAAMVKLIIGIKVHSKSCQQSFQGIVFIPLLECLDRAHALGQGGRGQVYAPSGQIQRYGYGCQSIGLSHGRFGRFCGWFGRWFGLQFLPIDGWKSHPG